MHDNLNACSMHKQNVKKANKTAEIDGSCRSVGHASEERSKLGLAQEGGVNFACAAMRLRGR